ncbi:hypothetical protein E4U61_005231 [Claviceps capensis]|nr:hypothetical protein E4U61_005231 [Claviceps capensis]
MVLEHLNTKVFDTSSLHDCFSGTPSSTPKMASHDANPPTRDGLGPNVSHAAIASRGASRTIASAAVARVAPPKAKTKEDTRVLVTVAEGAPRLEPFQLRHKLVTMLEG